MVRAPTQHNSGEWLKEGGGKATKILSAGSVTVAYRDWKG